MTLTHHLCGSSIRDEVIDCSQLARGIVDRLSVWLQPGKEKKMQLQKFPLLGTVDSWLYDQHLIHPSLGANLVKASVGISYIFICFCVSLQRCLWICSLLTRVSYLKCSVMSLPFPLVWCLLFLLSLDWRYGAGMTHKQQGGVLRAGGVSTNQLSQYNQSSSQAIRLKWQCHDGPTTSASQQRPLVSDGCQSQAMRHYKIKQK